MLVVLCIKQRWRRLVGIHFLNHGDQGRCAVAGNHCRDAQTAPLHIAHKLAPGSAAFLVAQRQMQQHLAPIAADAPGTQQGFFHVALPSQALVDGIHKQIFDLKRAQIALAEMLVIFPQTVGNLAHCAAAQQQLPAVGIAESVLYSAGGQASAVHLRHQILQHIAVAAQELS
jgi:hypothetical protein